MMVSSDVTATASADIAACRVLVINVLHHNEWGKVEFYLCSRLAWVAQPELRVGLDVEGHFLPCQWIQA